jgi:putative FmdB family regulatory protein
VPTYEYLCADCGAETEVRASITEKTAGLRPACPACAGTALRQVFRPVARVGGGSVPLASGMPVASAGPGGGPGGGCCGGGCCG